MDIELTDVLRTIRRCSVSSRATLFTHCEDVDSKDSGVRRFFWDATYIYYQEYLLSSVS